MRIYKLLRAPEWAEFERAGRTDGAPADRADGFIHFSTAAQLPGTLAKHFPGERALWLLAAEADDFGRDLRWEPARGGELFPHLYRALRRADLLWARPLAEERAGPRLPDDLA